MSLRIIKQGILDTVQDLGRYGHQHLGINPNGAMDRFSMQSVNMLVGNNANEAVIEMHYPAPVILFEQEAMIAIGGGDFSATLNGEEISLFQPILVSKNSVVQFEHWKSGARCYLAIREKLDINPWLNSYSTNIKAGCGGFNGRALQKYDMVGFRNCHSYKDYLKDKDHVLLPWKANTNRDHLTVVKIATLPGKEWDWLSEDSQQKFLNGSFVIDTSADRMGYRLKGSLEAKENTELVSSAVSFGTIQLLPNGELIVLMADHQTTGGYPTVGHVVAACLSLLAQKKPGDEIGFEFVDQPAAEKLIIKQEQHLQQLQNACTFRLQEFFNTKNADH